jgi:hypothetical protein
VRVEGGRVRLARWKGLEGFTEGQALTRFGFAIIDLNNRNGTVRKEKANIKKTSVLFSLVVVKHSCSIHNIA